MSETVEVSVELKHETQDAYLISDGYVEQWISKSQVISERKNSSDDIIELEIPEWLAKEKGLI